MKLRMGTRGSRLALAQAHSVKSALERLHPGAQVEIVTLKTSGDLGDREKIGAFVGEIQEALLRSEIDVGLHCLKDLPTDPVQGLRLSAYLEREDARDALITRGPNQYEMAGGSVLGTGSVRRTSQLAAHRGDLDFRPLVGNVDTRLRKLMAGEYDGIVLAMAALLRLGVLDVWSESEFGSLTVHPLSFEEMLPAPGQAVLVLETRDEDHISHGWATLLNDSNVEVAATSERSFLSAFGGGCSVPVAAFAHLDQGVIVLDGLVASPDGRTVLRSTMREQGEGGALLGARLAEELGKEGAFALIEASRQIAEARP